MHEQRRRQDGEVIPTTTLAKCEVHCTGIQSTDTIKLVLALAWHQVLVGLRFYPGQPRHYKNKNIEGFIQFTVQSSRFTVHGRCAGATDKIKGVPFKM